MPTIIDPVKKAEQFKADLKAMELPRVDGAPAITHRAHKDNFGLVQFKFNRWSVELTEAQTLDDAMRPQFWAHVTDNIMGHDKLKPKGRGDVIEVRKIDTGLYAELLITEIGAGFVKVAKIAKYEPPEVAIPEASPLATRWNPGAKTHEVIRKDDRALMRGGFQTKAAAVAWIAEHMKAMAA